MITACSPDPEPGQPAALFGQGGYGPAEFNYPRALAATPDHLYIIDKAARVQCLTHAGKFLREWQMPASDAGKPVGVASAPDGRVFIPDTHYYRVLIYSPAGELLDTLGEKGQGPGQFLLTTDVAFDSAGNVYVGEYGGNDRISKFTPNLEFIASFGGPDAGDATLARPQGLCMGPDDTLWVADSCHHRICRFDTDGRLLAAFGELGQAPGQFRYPYGVDLLPDGTLVVAEFGNNRVQRVTQTGEPLGTWGGPGRDPGQLASPWGLAVLPRGDVAILDSKNNRVQVIDGMRAGTWTRPPAGARNTRRSAYSP